MLEIKKTISFLLLYAVIISCSKPQNNYDKVGFRVDENLLDTTIFINKHAKITYRLPKDFTEIHITSDASFKSLPLDSLSNLKSVEKRLFFNQKNKIIFIVSSIDNKKTTKEEVESLQSFLENRSLWKDIKFSKFMYNGIKFNQFILQEKKYVIFKLLLDCNIEKGLLEMNYILPLEFYDDKMAKTLESSIGSIKNIN